MKFECEDAPRIHLDTISHRVYDGFREWQYTLRDDDCIRKFFSAENDIICECKGTTQNEIKRTL